MNQQIRKWCVLVGIYAFSCSATATLNCEQGQLRIPYLGKAKIITQIFCTNTQGTELLSASCIEKKCSAFRSKVKINLSQMYSNRGTPSFHLCHQLGGTPQIVDIAVQGQ